MEFNDLLINLIIGIAFLILGSVITYFYTIKSSQKRIEYEIKSYRLISEKLSEKLSQNPLFQFHLGDEPIISLTSTIVKIENTGYNEIESDDIAPGGPIQITAQNNIRIYHGQISERHGTNNDFDLLTENNISRLSFHHINSGEGVKIQIFHSGIGDDDIKITGTVVGGPLLSKKSDWKVNFKGLSTAYASVITTVFIFGFVLLNFNSNIVAIASAVVIVVFGFLFGILVIMVFSQKLFSKIYDEGLKLLKISKW
jgi:hypothetical protein